MKKRTTGVCDVAVGQNNLDICSLGFFNVAIGLTMNYGVHIYNSICIGSGVREIFQRWIMYA